MLLRLHDLASGYERTQVLRKVSLDVDDGEIVTLLGRNGAGKTTTLRAVSGLLPVWDGLIEFAGHPLNRQSPEQRAVLGLGHVPEGRGILASLSVEQNLDLGLSLRKDGSSAIKSDRDHLLDLFPPIAERLKESAASLSGGQQQMLVLARAMLTKPRLLMIDELSFGLSPLLVDQLFDLIGQFREDGSSFLLVEQDSGALKVSDRTFVLSGGRTSLEARSSELAGSDDLLRSYLGEVAQPTSTTDNVQSRE